MKHTALILIIFFIVGCESENPTVKTKLRVNHYQWPMIAEGNFLTYIIQEKEQIGTDEWIHTFDIEGFTFERGYIYDLSVEKIELKNPPTDASSARYKLINILSKNKVTASTIFEVPLSYQYTSGEHTTFVGGSQSLGYHLMTIPIDCSELCDELTQNLADKKAMTGVFIHDSNAISLIELKN